MKQPNLSKCICHCKTSLKAHITDLPKPTFTPSKQLKSLLTCSNNFIEFCVDFSTYLHTPFLCSEVKIQRENTVTHWLARCGHTVDRILKAVNDM